MSESSRRSPTPVRYRWLLHIDLDQFQVAVERLRSPELVGVAVIVGGNGDPTEARKVVTCASYEARAVGVRAGMPLRAAYRKLPDAVYLPLDMAAYDAASAQVMNILRESGHPIEVWGWDEAYAGVDEGTDAEIRTLAAGLREQVAHRSGLTCRIGISDNKQRAKMATGFAKRDPAGGVFLLDSRNWLPLMGSAPTRDLWSVGPRTAEKLTEMGVSTVDELIATAREDLIARFGPHQGNWLYVLCRGGGDSTITGEPFVAKSHSKSRTFATDLTDPDEIATAATELTEELRAQIVAEGRVAFRAAVTVRTSTFYTRTKLQKLPAPSTDSAVIIPVVVELLGKFEQGRPIRMLGVRLDLVEDSDGAAGDGDEPD
ncbi:DNA polymerase IV [Gordonia oryzae]|uniref:DNA-directed DNA polymerase n=1 Tax=Gordonia oryzae TaxID=2487349 RepID=A0A3N4G2P4_9ACTN|nr:DNA polymerase IV [Gordonia oryzae]RPA57212.1 DNA polymerase IV [Gordonia oryzae]